MDKIEQIAEVIEKIGKPLMQMRDGLETIFPKKNIDFNLSPVSHFRISTPKGTIIITHKDNAEKWDKIAGVYAIGYQN